MIDPASDARAAERALAIGYAPAAVRTALTTLFDLDARLGAILRSTREPLVGQMRLTWWFDALTALDDAPAPAEPLLVATAATLLPHGVTGRMLAGMIDGWEALLAQPLTEQEAMTFAQARGGALFAAAGTMLAADDATIATAGEGWALADLAMHLSDAGLRERVRQLADARLADALGRRWSRRARPLGAIALMARADLHGTAAASPRRVGRMLLHRVTGR